MKKYDHKEIEKKWQDRWEKDRLYTTDDDSPLPKEYILSMFPYPSGVGLHVGHIEGYTATDIYARYKRMSGHNVLHPMGWDAFGLPAENYAIKTGVHPKETIFRAIGNFKRQIKSVGLSYDWDREVCTHLPKYYRWTQWLFLELYKEGYAYKKNVAVNWDPVDQTVLANEQVLSDGTAERSGAKVEKRNLEQWMFKITDFSAELIDDLDTVDWPTSTVTTQRNWIGKSVGAEFDFCIGHTAMTVFTTRPDTIFGVSAIIVAPEHPILAELKYTNKKEVDSYIKENEHKNDAEKFNDKTGLKLEGISAVNPATLKEIPVYVADYVIAQYGTGVIMSVPGHDKRDNEFAKNFSLEITKVLSGDEGPDQIYEGSGSLINSGEFTGRNNIEVQEEITKHFGGKLKTEYRLRDWLVSRQRYWGVPIPIVYDPEGKAHPVPDEHLPWRLPTDVEFKPTGTSPLGDSKELKDRVEKIFGKGWTPEIDTMDTFVCSSWYFLRYTDPQNMEEFASKENLEKWLPVDLYVGGAEHAVLHLMYVRFITKFLHKFGHISFNEPFKKLRHQGMILAEDGRKMSKSLGNVINPDDVIEQCGADTLRLYEMFIGPIKDTKPWSTKSISGPRRFLEKVWRLQEKVDESISNGNGNILHKSIKKIENDIQSYEFNTSISQLMIFTNELEKEEKISLEVYKNLLIILAPFAPHMTEEIWENLGNKDSIHLQEWPKYDENKVLEDVFTIPVQVNGKVRGAIEMPANSSEGEVLKVALLAENVQKWIGDNEIKKTIYVKNRVINLLVDSI